MTNNKINVNIRPRLTQHIPTGSGTVESAIRRVINLCIKGAGLSWGREHAENMNFLRSLVLTGKLKNACRKGLGG